MLPKPWERFGSSPPVTTRSGKEDLFPGSLQSPGKTNQTVRLHQERTEEGAETGACARGCVQHQELLLPFYNSTLVIIKKWS